MLTIPHKKIKDVFDEQRRITCFNFSPWTLINLYPQAFSCPCPRTDPETSSGWWLKVARPILTSCWPSLILHLFTSCWTCFRISPRVITNPFAAEDSKICDWARAEPIFLELYRAWANWTKLNKLFAFAHRKHLIFFWMRYGHDDYRGGAINLSSWFRSFFEWFFIMIWHFTEKMTSESQKSP